MADIAHWRSQHRLFVYGTLRPDSGHPMGRVLAHNARWIGNAAIRGRLSWIGPYAAAVEDHAAGWLQGELFEITGGAFVWRALDRYEGCEDETDEYERRRVPVRYEHASTPRWTTAWCYVLANAGNSALRPAGRPLAHVSRLR